MNLQWKSEGPEITWIWDPVEDRALQPLVDSYVSLLTPALPECPSFDKAPVTGDFMDLNLPTVGEHGLGDFGYHPRH